MDSPVALVVLLVLVLVVIGVLTWIARRGRIQQPRPAEAARAGAGRADTPRTTAGRANTAVATARSPRAVDPAPARQPAQPGSPGRLLDRLGGRLGGPQRRRPGPAIRPVEPLLLTPPGESTPEPPLLDAVIDCTRQTSLIQGRCGGQDGVVTLTVRAASLRGIGHAVAGKIGQDAAAIRWHEPARTLYVAVADGLGSLPESDAAARAAVEAAITHAESVPASSGTDRGSVLFTRIVRDVQAVVGVGTGPDQRGTGPDQRGTGATTLAVAEVRPVPDGALVTVWAVGDSEVWLLDPGPDGWQPLHHERDGARENATRQLPRHPRPYTNRARVPRGSVLLLATDGFASSLGARSQLGQTLARLWHEAPSPLDFAAQVGFVDPYYADDRTAVAIWIG